MVFVVNSFFTTKDEYFRVAIAEVCDSFNKMLLLFLFHYLTFLHLFLMILVERVDSLPSNLLHTKLSLLWCTFAYINSIGYHHPSYFTSHPRVTSHWSSPSSLDFDIVTAFQHYHWSSWSLLFFIVTRLLHRYRSTLCSRRKAMDFKLQ